jgi:class 3 adenylate cyclase
VHIGARIAALGGPGELLTSSTVRDLVVGSGIEFGVHGRHAHKGRPDPWTVYRVLGDRDDDRVARMRIEDDREVTVLDRAMASVSRSHPRVAHPFLRQKT